MIQPLTSSIIIIPALTIQNKKKLVSANYEKERKRKKEVRALPECLLLHTHSYFLFPFVAPSSQPHPTT